MKKDELKVVPIENIEGVIYFIRGQKVMMDRDLAKLYGATTKKLLQAVKRNKERFPVDFMFQLTKEELENWRSQFVTSNSSSKMGLRRCPYLFTEQGVAMLSGVIRSPQAVMVNVEIMRTFIKLRRSLSFHKEITKELSELKEFVLKNSLKNNQEFQRIWQVIEKLTTPPQKKERKIGFRLD